MRGVENNDVCQWTLDVYENVNTFVECSKLPDNFAVITVKYAINDLIMSAKISFFSTLLWLLNLSLDSFNLMVH